jgi:uncharacterized repeat protein (TIGR02543 family)
MKHIKLKQIIWLVVVLIAVIILVSTHLTLMHAIIDKPLMGINGSSVLEIDTYKTDSEEIKDVEHASLAGFEEFFFYKKEKFCLFITTCNDSKLLMMLDESKWKQNPYSFINPILDMNKLSLEPKQVLTNSESNLNYNVLTVPVFTNSINILENRTFINYNSKVKNIKISNLIDRETNVSDREWFSQEYEVILPIGASMPTNAIVKYDDGSKQRLKVNKTGDNLYTLTNFKNIYFNHSEIYYDINFASVNEEQVTILGNYKFTVVDSLGSTEDYNVWGSDYTNLVDEYTLDFDLNEADFGIKPESKMYAFGDKTIRPATTNLKKTGYTFNGWAESPSEYSRLWDFVNDRMPNNNKTLYANWLRNIYKVQYITNSLETPTIEEQEFAYGEKITEFKKPYKKGYEFIEWNRNLNLHGKTWNFLTDSMPDHNITLYAKYIPNKYEIKYMYNDERGIFYQHYIFYDSKIKKPWIPYKKGHQFLGWNVDPKGTGDFYNFTDVYNEDENTILYAIWEINEPKFNYWTSSFSTNSIIFSNNYFLNFNNINIYSQSNVNYFGHQLDYQVFYLNELTKLVQNTTAQSRIFNFSSYLEIVNYSKLKYDKSTEIDFNFEYANIEEQNIKSDYNLRPFI